MRFHLRKVRILGQIPLKVLFPAKCVEVDKRGIVFRVAGIAHFQVIGVGIHSHDFPLDFVRRIGKIDTISQGFTHLCHAVRSRQTKTGFILGKNRLRLRQGLSV